MRCAWIVMLAWAGLWAFGGPGADAEEPGERPALAQHRLSQEDIAAGRASLMEIRRFGLMTFSTPFNRLDGYGRGPRNRPTLQGNGTFLRVDGLDAQMCLECHSVVRGASVPPGLGVGGVGGSNSNAIILPTSIDAGDANGDGVADFDGRFANPPFIFGSGAVELLALEMTADLQALKGQALAQPGTTVELLTKGVWFGQIVADAAGVIDTSNVMGVARDLVVRPFGRKGEFSTVRAFDLEATQFHFGMEPTEVVGEGVDRDGDGVVNELLPGDLSALHVFATTMDRPYMEPLRGAARRGYERFQELGCVGCHMPSLETARRHLPLRLPEVETRPFDNEYFSIDLSLQPMGFERTRAGGLVVPLFSDLKRHDMGEGLKESFRLADDETNRTFVTARLWGVADTGPWLHDGRATTLSDAILAHGGEAQPVRDRFAGLSAGGREDVLAFLRSLRTPKDPARDVRDYLEKVGADAPPRLDPRPDAPPGKSDKANGGKSSRRHAAQQGRWWADLLERCVAGR